MRCCTESSIVENACDQRFFGDRLFEVGHRAQRQATPPVLVSGNNVDRDVARGRIMLQTIENRPARHIRQADVERDRAGLEFPRQRKRRAAAQCHQRLQVMLVREIKQDAGEREVVFDDQQGPDRLG